MKKVLLITCIAALVLMVATTAMAADNNWRVFLRASTPTYGNYTPAATLGVSTTKTDNFDSGFGGDSVYTAPQSTQACIASLEDPAKGFANNPPLYKTSYKQSFTEGAKTWDLVLWTGSTWGDMGAVRVGIYGNSSYLTTDTFTYTLKVINDPTGTYAAGKTWELTPGMLGTADIPAFTIDFNNGGAISASTDSVAKDVGVRMQFTANAGVVPEPGSMLALGSGLIGMAGFAIRRRRA